MNSFLRQCAPAPALGLALMLAVGGNAQAAVSGPAGWQTLGDVASQGADLVLTTAFVDGIDDEPGNLSGLPALMAFDLELAAGLAPRALDLSDDDYATEGSMVLRSVSVQAGDTLRLQWSFSSSDMAQADHAFVVIGSDVFKLASARQALAGAGSFAHTFAQGGNVLVGAGVVDSVDFTGVSTLSLSGFEVLAVPEPATAALWLAGLGLLAGLARRRA